jgi:hypothetical protein
VPWLAGKLPGRRRGDAGELARGRETRIAAEPEVHKGVRAEETVAASRLGSRVCRWRCKVRAGYGPRTDWSVGRFVGAFATRPSRQRDLGIDFRRGPLGPKGALVPSGGKARRPRSCAYVPRHCPRQPNGSLSVQTDGFYANAVALAHTSTGRSLFGPFLRAVTTRVLVRR